MLTLRELLIRTVFLSFLVSELLLCDVQAAGRKYALLIGVQNYDPTQLTSLNYSEADVIAVGAALEKLGFDVIVMTRQASIPDRVPVTADDILKQIQRRVRDRDPDDTIVIMLSGHGVQLKSDPLKPDGTRESYFCPERANLNDRSTLLALSQVVNVVQSCKAGRKLLLVDACRNEVQPKAVADKGGSPVTIELDPAGVTRRTIPQGMFALFSCSPKERSFEMTDLQHSVFSYHVLQYLNGNADSNRYPRRELQISEMVTFVSSETRDYIDRHLGKDQNPQWLTPGGGLTDWPLGRLGELEDLITNSIGMKLKLIPAGEFLMGSSDTDVAAALKADSDVTAENLKYEKPQHRVRISRPFYAGVYEVTQGEYEAVMGENPSWFSSSGDGKDQVGGMSTKRFPVETVSWYDAIQFCNKLSQRENLKPYYSLTSVEREDGRITSATVSRASVNSASRERQSPDTSGYRLPTEAEWEYMCRAGTASAFSFGNVLNGDKANVNGSYPFGTSKKGSYLERTTNVGSYSANRFGLHDMHGSVWEWCFDVFDESAYGSRIGVSVDPVSVNGSEYRVLRGGSWMNGSRHARSAFRNWDPPVNRSVSFNGLRVVR